MVSVVQQTTFGTEGKEKKERKKERKKDVEKIYTLA